MALSKEIQGFLPNWLSADTYLSLDYNSISTIIWFSLVPQSDGSFLKEGYPPTNLINYAHNNGKKIILCLHTDWGSPVTDTILASPSLQTTVINNAFAEVQANNFDGIDINFEGFPATNTVNQQPNRTLYTQFITALSNKFRSSTKNYRISIDLPPVDWDNVFDTSILSSYADYFMIMLYDYHWGNEPAAGPVSPINSPDNISVTNSINTYLLTIPSSKLLAGFPWYGYEWPTQTNQIGSATTGTATSLMYSEVVNTKITRYQRHWDSESQTPYYMYQLSNQWYQGWYDDAESLSIKFDLINQKGLAGIGIWAFGYDLPHRELSDLILSKYAGILQPIQCDPGFISIAQQCYDLKYVVGGGVGLLILLVLLK